ncbi:hypothetical protein M407DRAFT_235066 [Tulasnella calospora MUT 4182]|uniref:Uncharacterized protein n=1 Tax=Tulasnella calospora MUT 4182 TaxID=1051891 RepID=A0A0C3QI50_9AGAM|nr:hypothetical protein M407DRAFT_235066 [Tulasnella calospora MUT 4182]
MFDVGTPEDTAETSSHSGPHPVCIEESTKDFESFLNFVIKQMGPDTNPLDFTTAQWKGILLVGHKYENENAEQKAIAYLTNAADVTPAEQFYMAVKFKVSDWLLPSAKLLAVTDFEDLSLTDEKYLQALLPPSVNALRPLGVMKESIRRTRDQLSVFSLPITHDIIMCGFGQNASCKGKWDAVFSEHLKMFLEEGVWVSGREVFAALRAAKYQSGVTPACWDSMIQTLDTRQSLWAGEEDALNQGIRYMSGHQALAIPDETS